MKRAIADILAFLFILAFFSPVYAQNLSDDSLLLEKSSGFILRGHYKNLLTCFSTDAFQENFTDTPSHKTLISDLNRLRLSPEYKFSENFLIHADADTEIIAANYAGSRTFGMYWKSSDYNELIKADADANLSGDGYFRINLHRFYAKWVSGKFTLTAGRQQIRFGSGRLWNPLDILNPISPTFVEGAEDQSGTDALRLEYYPEPSTEIAFVYAPKRQNDAASWDMIANQNTNIITRARTTIKGADVAILGGRAGRKNLGGADTAIIAWDGMFRASVLYADPDNDSAYFLSSMGYEYTFAGGIYFLLEYFYNGRSLNTDEKLKQAWQEYPDINEENYPYFANTFLTLNRHYTGLALGREITPLLRGDIFMILDLEGIGLFISPGITYNISQNVDISISAMLGAVSEKENKPSDFKDFENHPMIFTSLKWYF